ncbi:MAG: AbrB family transcriptional regulator, partial [Methylobacteriaceae bacterium]|nr:AbrB family transcriptional regulator [Methylobacteriaceae bacterium]
VTITITSGAPPSGLPGAGKQVMDMMPLIVILCGGVVLGFLFEHINLSGGFLVAGLVISLTVHVMELVPGVVPQPLALVGTTVVGTFIGERFGMVEWKTVRRMLPVAAGSACIQIVIAAIIAVPGAWAAKATVMDGLLAFAPGQQEVMSLLALTLGLNPLFVVTHQLMRFLSITLTLPIWYPILADWEDRRDARRAAESAKDDSPGSGTA